jgi:hypothetical protein
MGGWLSRYRFSAIELWMITASSVLAYEGHWIVALVTCGAGAVAQAIAESGAR